MNIKRIEKIKGKLKLRDKLLISFLLLTSISVLIASVLFYMRSSDVLIENTKEITHQSMLQASEYISYRLTNSKDISSMAYLDSELKEMIVAFKAETESKSKMNQYTRLSKRIANMGIGRDVYNVRLYIDDQYISSAGKTKVISEDLIKNEPWYESVIEGKGQIIWVPTYEQDYIMPLKTQRIISLARIIPSENVRDDHLAVLVIDLLEDQIRDIIEQVSITEKGEVHLINRHGYVLTSSDQEMISTFVQFEDYVPFQDRYGNGERRFKKDGQDMMLFHHRIPHMDWQLISMIPIEEITHDATEILRFMIVVLILITSIAGFISLRLAHSITYRIEDLSANMDQIKDDNWNLDLDIPYDDEIGDLQRNFIYMTQSMQSLINDKYQAEIDLRKAELRVLQAQINPHFLYNILDLINWLALQHGADDINEIVEDLAKFFRLSLSSGREMVLIRDELEHIRLYVEIQNKRFDNNIKLSFDVDESILDYYTINLLLQPLVENSILHGINEKKIKQGEIKIIAYQDIESVRIEVVDDGVGMSERKIREILSGSIDDAYGVRNVNERLTIRFGPTYGLSYESEEDKGTKALVEIPIIDHLEED